MSFGTVDNLCGEIDDLVRDWYSSPVVLVSSSDYKRGQLQELGFAAIDCVPCSDVFEREQQEVWDKREFGTFYDSRKSEAAVFIARKKLEGVLKRGGIDQEAFVFAFDTMPHIYVYRDKNAAFDVRSKLWNAVHMSKPRDFVAAKAMIAKAYEVVLEGEYAFRQMDEAYRMAGVDPQMMAVTSNGRKWGHLPRNVNVLTGCAIRLPNEDKVETCCADVRLELQAIYPFLQHDGGIDRKALSCFVDGLVEMQGDRVMQISGGVDYADPKVREYLLINELSLSAESAEDGVCKGVPIKKLREWIRRLAMDRLGISAMF